MSHEDIGNFYQLGQPYNYYSHQFQTQVITYPVTFRNLQEVPHLHIVIEIVFDQMVNRILDQYKARPRDIIGIQIDHPALTKPIHYPFGRRSQFSGRKLVRLVESVIQSREQLDFDSEMRIKIVIVTLPEGRGGRDIKRTMVDLKKWMKTHEGHGRCFIPIGNKYDNLCLARAVVTAIAMINKHDPDYHWETIRKGDKNRATLQKQKARELMRKAGMYDYQGPCGIEELKKMEPFLNGYQVKIYDKFAKPIHIGPTATNIIHLLYYDDHYTIVTSMPAFLGNSYYCDLCEKGYDHLDKHRCNAKCNSCYRPGKCNQDEHGKTCYDCNRFFYNAQCFANHTSKYQDNKTICQKIKKCVQCHELYRTTEKNQHICGYKECRFCKEFVHKETHKCYMQPLPLPEAPSKFKYIFFDFEATQDTHYAETEDGPSYEHKINLAVAQYVCELCHTNHNIGECPKCGEGQKIFNSRDEFCSWLFDDINRDAIAIAHFMKGYDGQFILQYLQEQGIAPEIIPKGTELMSIYVKEVNLRIIDSINFFNMKLSALPKTFDIPELKKGYFPHLFNTQENANHESDHHPDAFFYQPANMKNEEREKFYDWYAKNSNKPYKHREELIAYCISDVDILRRSCTKFRSQFLTDNKIDPFSNAQTIASACNKVFRTQFLQPHTIGIIHRTNDNQSVTALKWLKWISNTENVEIQHARNGGEVTIAGYKLDGMRDNTIYEFHGCYWHGCRTCLKPNQITADRWTTADTAYEKTTRKINLLRGMGYTVIEKWECELKLELENNTLMKAFFNNVTVVEPLNPRDAFYGGRVNATKLYHKAGNNENIKYYDVVSLYPYVNKYGKYPIGHPKIITENFLEITTQSHPYEGIIKCIIVPPRRLYHPVLPYRCNKKLNFPLCAMCCELKNKEPCQHTRSQRALAGTWVTEEIYKALEKGYEIEEIFEVWHYEETSQYNPDSKTGGIFASYINRFLKMKQEADGWPIQIQTEDDKLHYIQSYNEKEGVLLEKDNINKNPGARAVAKLCLNSFWGKCGQRDNQSKRKYFNNFAEYCQLITDPTLDIKSVTFINDNLVEVHYCSVDDMVCVMNNTNVVIAAYTTCLARLKLYSYIERLDRRVLYFDTDSIIFLSQPGQWEPPTGSYLGDLSDELKGYPPGSYISKFVSGGPKNYAFKIRDASGKCIDQICKVRGYTLSFEKAKKINFKCMRRMVESFVENGCREEFDVVYSKIVRKGNKKVVTQFERKTYRLTYDKRIVLQNYTTLPYGYFQC